VCVYVSGRPRSTFPFNLQRPFRARLAESQQAIERLDKVRAARNAELKHVRVQLAEAKEMHMALTQGSPGTQVLTLMSILNLLAT
jgi:hypothetical protein